MRIGFVSFAHLRDWTGITRLIDQLAAEMSARGHEVVIIAQEGKASGKVPVSRREYPHELITLDFKDADGRKAAREKIAASGVDICAASIGDNQLLYMPRLFSGSGIPYVIGEPANPCIFTFERWQPYEHYGALYSADAIQVLLAEYVPFYPEPLRRRITLIGNPAPPPVMVDLAARRNKPTRTIIAVGRFNEADKRFSLLIRAFALLQRDFPAWRLKLVGDGPFWSFYHEMVRQLGIKGLVEFTGAVADPNPHYAGADLFCLPSSQFEGFGLVFAEAAAAALPLVGFRSCTAACALLEPGTGALAETTPEGDTAETLAAALRPLMKLEPEGREALGVKAREVFQERYGGSVVYDQWETLLREICQKARESGETALERISMKNQIGPEWEGLEPDSPLWTPEILGQAALEIAGRETPLTTPEEPGATEAEIVRLRCELARLRQDYGGLEKKYASLMGQYQMLANKRGKR